MDVRDKQKSRCLLSFLVGDIDQGRISHTNVSLNKILLTYRKRKVQIRRHRNGWEIDSIAIAKNLQTPPIVVAGA